MNAPNTAIVRVTAEPQTMAELKDFAAMAAESRFFGADTPQQALMIAMAGKDLGFSYTQSLRMFHVIKGKPSLSADGMVAAVLARTDICEYFDVVELSDTKAVYETKRRGRPNPVRYMFTLDDAKRAELVGGNWAKHPRRMLSARCKAFLARDVYPDVLGGLLEQDEAREVASSTNVIQATVIESAPSPTAGLVERILAASTVPELEAIALDIKRADVGEWDLSKLRSLYTQRMMAIEPPAAPMPVVVEAATAREPGED